MEKKLQELFQEYKNEPSVKTQQTISKFYIKNIEYRKEIEKNIKDFVRQDFVLKGGVSWTIFFENNMKFWEELYLIEEEKEALKNYNRFLKSENNHFLLEGSVDLCEIGCINIKEVQGLPEKVEKVWLDVFKKYPEFKIILDENRKKAEERLKKYLEKLNNSPKEPLKTLKVLELNVPILPLSEGLPIKNFENIKNQEEYQEFMNERVKYFNNFHLEGYIEMPECHSITMKIDDNNYSFILEINQEIDQQKLKEELLGQLSDGLGESLAQRRLLIGNQEYVFDFDINNASDFVELKPITKLKIKS